jgi:hypothetical protein
VETDIKPGSWADSIAAPGGDSPAVPTPWGDSFLVDGKKNEPIRLAQVTAKDFKLVGTIDFVADMGLDARRFPAITDAMKKAACHLDGATFDSSDLASVPRFLRWFENSYGRHTPAALIHDNLIGNKPNSGALGSDTASDRFFRYMLASVGVPFFKRWIMWAAVAFRTRWAVGGWRRLTLVVWVILAAAGIAALAWAIVAIVTGSDGPGDLNRWALLGISLAAPVLAGALWGRQWGASLVTAVAAPFVLPPMAIAAVGYFLYWILERVARLVDLH